jgi:hypothetical protein
MGSKREELAQRPAIVPSLATYCLDCVQFIGRNARNHTRDNCPHESDQKKRARCRGLGHVTEDGGICGACQAEYAELLPKRAAANFPSNYKCRHCGKLGTDPDPHYKEDCPTRTTLLRPENKQRQLETVTEREQAQQRRCFTCNRAGHVRKHCPYYCKYCKMLSSTARDADAHADCSWDKRLVCIPCLRWSSGRVKTWHRTPEEECPGSLSLPAAGYVCRECGQRGGEPGAHWFMYCPTLSARSRGNGSQRLEVNGHVARDDGDQLSSYDDDAAVSYSARTSDDAADTIEAASSGFVYPLPGEGYVCWICGQPGGVPDAHWYQQCPHWQSVQTGSNVCVGFYLGHYVFVALAAPKAGYVCYKCGQRGGEQGAHWHQECPAVPGPDPVFVQFKEYSLIQVCSMCCGEHHYSECYLAAEAYYNNVYRFCNTRGAHWSANCWSSPDTDESQQWPTTFSKGPSVSEPLLPSTLTPERAVIARPKVRFSAGGW